ncbi:MAG: hypothetical protein HY716_04520 [Planctomycetes bacterium]|nr:hypothetical protein [Planctomycetota bacterium]
MQNTPVVLPRAPRARSDRGISMVLVVILVMITFVMVVTGVLLWARLSHMQRVQEELKEHLDRANKEEGLLKKQMKDALAPSGLLPSPDEDIGTLSTAKGREELNRRRAKVFVPLDPKRPDPPELGQRREESGLYPTLESLVTAQSAKLSQLQLQYEHAKMDAEVAKIHEEVRKSTRAPLIRPKENYRARLEANLNDIRAKIQTEEQQYQKRRTELQTTLDETLKLIGDEELALNSWEIRQNNRIKRLRQRLNEMKVKEVIKHQTVVTHGQLLRPDVRQEKAFINIGSRERVVPGLFFKVAQPGRHGRFDFKALIEVKKVWLDFSEVAVVRRYEGTPPLVEGDMIINPLFHTRRPLVVAFSGLLGDRSRTMRMSAQDAANRIREIGSDPRMNVGLDADFVLFTEVDRDMTRESYADYQKAVLLEIPIAEASEYYDYLAP